VEPGERDVRAETRALRQRVIAERQRAERDASLADKYEKQFALAPEPLKPLSARLRDLHRRVQARHLATARVIELHATWTEEWHNRADAAAARPRFVAAVASWLGMPSATVTLRGSEHVAAVAAASDPTARAANELEILMAEGPVTDATARGTFIAGAGRSLLDWWPRYGPAAAELGVRAVVAAPLGPPETRIGALCAYGSEPVIPVGVAIATDCMAEALTQMILADVWEPGACQDSPAPPVFDEADYRSVIHQAAGMVSVQFDCGVDVAEDLLAARAFADGVPVERIAIQVVCGGLSLR